MARAARRDQMGIALTVVVDAVKRSAARVAVVVENIVDIRGGGVFSGEKV